VRQNKETRNNGIKIHYLRVCKRSGKISHGAKVLIKGIYLTQSVYFFAQNENSSGIDQMTVCLTGGGATTFLGSKPFSGI
jgi:hypothetical protein